MSYKKNGFELIKGFFEPEVISKIQIEAKNVFANQMKRLGISYDLESEENFLEGMARLFQEDFEAFVFCGKQVQHLISLHSIAVNDEIVGKLKAYELDSPVISTRPVLYFNHPDLAKEKVYNSVFAHQDWRSMQGSIDAMIIWIPLVSVSKKMGALRVIPESHKWGLVSTELDQGFGRVELDENQRSKFIDVQVEQGDALFFSSFLVHESGNNISDKIRWSCHFRYNNLNEQSFIDRKYFHPYIYRPEPTLRTAGFPTKEDIENIYDNE